jgi:hypothetical protein
MGPSRNGVTTMKQFDAEEIAEALREVVTEEALCEAIDEKTTGDDDLTELPTIQSFAAAGVLTNDAGFVIDLGGRQFQVTVVRSR